MSEYQKIAHDALKTLIRKMNADPFMEAAQIKFSERIDHVVDRAFDHDIDFAEVLRQFQWFLANKKCEIVYYCYLEDPPLRMNLESKNLIIGVSRSDLETPNGTLRLLRLRTVIKNFENRHPSKIRTLILKR